MEKELEEGTARPLLWKFSPSRPSGNATLSSVRQQEWKLHKAEECDTGIKEGAIFLLEIYMHSKLFHSFLIHDKQNGKLFSHPFFSFSFSFRKKSNPPGWLKRRESSILMVCSFIFADSLQIVGQGLRELTWGRRYTTAQNRQRRVSYRQL